MGKLFLISEIKPRSHGCTPWVKAGLFFAESEDKAIKISGINFHNCECSKNLIIKELSLNQQIYSVEYLCKKFFWENLNYQSY